MEFLMKMGFFHRLFGGQREESSRAAARERLRNALVGDRCSVAPAMVECMTGEVLDVLRKYMVVQERDMRLSISEKEGGMRFSAVVPVVRVLRQAHLPTAALADSSEPSGESSAERRHNPKRKLRGPRRRGSFEE